MTVKYAILYTQNNQNYYAVKYIDSTEHYFLEEGRIGTSEGERLVNCESEEEARFCVISGLVNYNPKLNFLHEYDATSLNFSYMLRENGHEDFKEELIRACHSSKVNNLLNNIDLEAKEICNEALESFYMVKIDQDFPNRVIEKKSLQLA